MEITQLYETTVGANNVEVEAATHFIVIPKRAFPNEEVFEYGILLQKLNLKELISIKSTSSLPLGLLTILVANSTKEAGDIYRQLSRNDVQNWTTQYQLQYEFTQYASFAELIPFEKSPLGLKSLASLAVASTFTGIVYFAPPSQTPLEVQPPKVEQVEQQQTADIALIVHRSDGTVMVIKAPPLGVTFGAIAGTEAAKEVGKDMYKSIKRFFIKNLK